MIKIYSYLFILVFLSACSFKSAPNAWQYKSINAFASYTKNFLSARDALAKNDLDRAVRHAKHSAKLVQLSRIYLGECALNISLGIEDKCIKYKELAPLVQDKKLDAYYKFIQSKVELGEIELLESNYQDFARYKIKNETKKAIENLFDMDKITSQLLSARLVQKELSFEDVQKLIDAASFYGYKKSVIYWLHVQKNKTSNSSLRKVIEKKIKVLG